MLRFTRLICSIASFRTVLLVSLLSVAPHRAERDSAIQTDHRAQLIAATRLKAHPDDAQGFKEIKLHITSNLEGVAGVLSKRAEEASKLAGEASQSMQNWHQHITDMTGTMQKMKKASDAMHGDMVNTLKLDLLRSTSQADGDLIEDANMAAEALKGDPDKKAADVAELYDNMDLGKQRRAAAMKLETPTQAEVEGYVKQDGHQASAVNSVVAQAQAAEDGAEHAAEDIVHSEKIETQSAWSAAAEFEPQAADHSVASQSEQAGPAAHSDAEELSEDHSDPEANSDAEVGSQVQSTGHSDDDATSNSLK